MQVLTTVLSLVCMASIHMHTADQSCQLLGAGADTVDRLSRSLCSTTGTRVCCLQMVALNMHTTGLPVQCSEAFQQAGGAALIM